MVLGRFQMFSVRCQTICKCVRFSREGVRWSQEGVSWYLNGVRFFQRCDMVLKKCEMVFRRCQLVFRRFQLVSRWYQIFLRRWKMSQQGVRWFSVSVVRSWDVVRQSVEEVRGSWECLKWSWDGFRWSLDWNVSASLGKVSDVEVSRSHTVSDGMYADMKIFFVSLLQEMFS